ncbi:helicase associated domain-containing protein [Streptomyces sp. NPDC004783]|uniref:helicase associated domain-containing protein n=1 Tax=Streptomyces sp. NPDC004783 TaxID=3154459 RepID=UPI0033A68146
MHRRLLADNPYLPHPLRRPDPHPPHALRNRAHRHKREHQEERELRLGAWVSNQRRRTAALSPGRVEQLSAVGMRWT